MNEPVLEPLLGRLFGRPAPTLELVKLKGDASTRQYYRARRMGPASEVPSSMIVMQLPADAPRSDEGGAQPNTGRLPFLEVGDLLSERGVPVPKIYGEDLERGVLLLEDLGDQTLHVALTKTAASSWLKHYERAVDLLADLHERCAELPESSIVRQRRFDRELLEWELDHFREWGLEALFGERSTAERAVIDDAFRAIVDTIERMPYGFVHRDYQSKNLMVSESGDLTLIDYQDAMIGPRAYDLVALLCDSYVSLDPKLQAAMIDRYAALRCIDRDELRSEFRWVTLHRKLKDAGRFVFIDRVRRNPDFLEWFPQSFVYVGRAVAETPALAGFGELLRTTIPGFPDSVEKPMSTAE
jgi:aminoglycoside/choline kinase family phosphotransferase